MNTTTTHTTTTTPTTTASTAAPSEPAAGRAAADTGARTESAAAAVSADRARIDDLDARIIALVRDRVAISSAIQRARIASGGRRVNLARETEIIATYSERLGRPGTALALTLLELCRGRV